MQCTNPFCLGEPFCSEWGSCSRMETPAKKSKLDSTLGRFSKPCSSAEMQVICQGYIPKNTCKATAWVLKVFKAWREQRAEEKDGKCLKDILDSPKVELLNFWLLHFVVEACCEDGKPYPPATINNILSGLNWFAKSKAPRGEVVPNFMDAKNPAFQDLRGALQVSFETYAKHLLVLLLNTPLLSARRRKIYCGNQKLLVIMFPWSF